MSSLKNKSAVSENVIKVRLARPEEAARLAELSGELGYPGTPKDIRARLHQLRRSRNDAVFAAEADGKVIGWIHVSRNLVLDSALRAEVNGLIVSSETRSRGAGKLLLAAADEWARQQKCKGMSVRSNVIRERAHAFYLREGYEHYKTQKAFRKAL